MRLTARRLAYWLATGLLALFMLRSACEYLVNPAVVAECHRLGFPDWLRLELAGAKLLGAAALLLPVGPRAKEWASAGFGIVLVSAALAHLAAGDGAKSVLGIVGLLGLLVAAGALRPGVGNLRGAA